MKPRINNAGTVTEFDTESELRTHINTISPNPDLTYFINQQKMELAGKQTVIELYKMVEDITPSLTDGEILDLINRVLPVQVALGDGMILLARKICNALPVAGQLTNGRKTAILNKIDQVIQTLN